MNARFIVPRRADRGHRDRLWKFCHRYWRKELPGYDIVEGDHTDGPFNRAAATNRGAQGEWGVAVIIDSDVILDPEQITEGVRRAADTGKMVLPFRRRLSVGEDGTRQILGGYQGSWRRWITERQTYNISTCVIAPRALWDEVGGFDERFVGWGGEDNAFESACRALAGVEKMDGDAWHLWHKWSPWRDHKSPLYRQAKALADRYISVRDDPDAMRRLLDEPRTADQVVVVCLTNGKRDTLGKTLHSAGEMLDGPIGRRVIAADACNPHHEGWETVPIQGGNYRRAVAKTIDLAIGSGQPWIFWLEDDFTFNEPTDLRAMQSVLAAHPELVQLSLKRQPWYPNEVAASGVIEANPAAFRQRDGYVEHADYWTFNPMLTRRDVLATYKWPAASNAERRFGERIFTPDTAARGGIVGHLNDPPRVTHIGTKRAGTGY